MSRTSGNTSSLGQHSCMGRLPPRPAVVVCGSVEGPVIGDVCPGLLVALELRTGSGASLK
jgi:hypothetical protein